MTSESSQCIEPYPTSRAWKVCMPSLYYLDILNVSLQVAPALAAGCTIVMKPSELTPLVSSTFVDPGPTTHAHSDRPPW